VLAWHPLADRRDATAFRLDAGRLYVGSLATGGRASRSVGRSGADRLLAKFPGVDPIFLDEPEKLPERGASSLFLEHLPGLRAGTRATAPVLYGRKVSAYSYGFCKAAGRGRRMEANEVSLNDVLLAGYELRVPIYQRRYSWEEEQHQRLWEQISRHYFLSSHSSRPPHFMGALVFVDGQQRLITLLVLLAAIREHGTPRVQSTIYERVAFPGKNPLRLRIVAGDHDRAILGECFDLDGEEWSKPKHRIARAWEFYAEAIQSGIHRPGHRRAERTNYQRLLQTVLNRLKFIRIVTDEGSNPQEIFETLNHDGLKLSQPDLIRNYLFMGVGRKVDSLYQETMQPAESALAGEQAMSNYLMSYLIADPRARALPHTPLKGNLFRSFKVMTQEAAGEPAAMVREVRRIGTNGLVFAGMLNAEVAGGQKACRTIRGQLRALHHWGSAPAHPVLFHLHRMHQGKRIDAAEYSRSLDLLLSFLVRRMLCNVGQSPLRSLFTRITLSPTFDLRSAQPSRALRTELSKAEWPDDDEVLAAARSRVLYGSARSAQVREVLNRLMIARQQSSGRRFLLDPYDAKATETLETSKWSIEHLMPQQPSKWGLKAKDVGSTVHTLGNLTLTLTNPEMSNAVWATKRDWFRAQRGVEEFARLAKHSTWSTTTITRRGREQAELACRVWRAP
jgi:hypothetical protein